MSRPPRRPFLFIRVLLLGMPLLFAALFHAEGAEPGFTGNCPLERGPKRVAVRTQDAETIMLDDRSEVRLIGALAPRSADGANPVIPWPPERDTIRALETLLVGRAVELTYAGRRKDR